MAIKTWVLFLVLLPAAGFGIWLAVDREMRVMVFNWFTRQGQELTGTTAGKTPDETLSKYKEAVEKRDYEWAARCCAGNSAEQLAKSAKAASEIQSRMDGLLGMMEQNGLKQDRVRETLRTRVKTMLPIAFPATVEKVSIQHKEGENRATGVVKLDGVQYSVEMKKGGEFWKLYYPDRIINLAGIDYLVAKYKEVGNALDQIKDEVRTEVTTQENVDRRLNERLDLVFK